MLTLGIHDGHTATACLFEDGRVLACISEERLNRAKEWDGFPELAIRKCLEVAGKDVGEIDAVGICSIMPLIGAEQYHNPQLYKRLFSRLTRVVPEKLLQSPKNIGYVQALSRLLFRSRRKLLLEMVSGLGIRTRNVFFYEHHRLHAATTYYTSWYRGRRTLAVTLDGSGDAVCAAVNVCEEGRIRRVAQVFNYNSICEFYTRVTQFLGMKPMSHEYKVMGLAPYAAEKESKEVLFFFRKYFKVSDRDPMQFVNTSGLWKWRFLEEFKERLACRRFDHVAAAAQKLFEEIVLRWVKNAINAIGVGDVALSGGGFMNVKLNYLISELSEISSLFIFPSSGDESTPVGAAILAALDTGFRHEDIAPLGTVFWGPSYEEGEVQRALESRLRGTGLKVSCHEDVNEKVAKQLAGGKIVGRFTGRMEWGARALGNRSILADPRDPSVIHRLNKAIKMRDFWMPFAPAILKECRDDYLDLRADLRCPFMTIAAPTKARAWGDIPAAIHPFDRTARAQVVEHADNPSFHRLLTRFRELTGVGGVLNTSFNLHGEPIVCSPEDALDTFLRSGLDALQIENFLVEK